MCALIQAAFWKGDEGDDVRYIGSTNGLNKLGSIKPEDLQKVREAFKENVHPRFMKEFFYHKPYGKGKLFKKKVDKANFAKLAKLAKIVALLLQTKAYLFWSVDTLL